MPVQLGASGQPDATQPIEWLMDCHRRIEHFLGVLERIAEQYDARPLDEQAGQAMETALGYFREAAPHHTADEEESLFPRLRALGRDDLRDVLDRAEQLERDHREAEQLHERVDRIGRMWLETGSLDAKQRDLLRNDLRVLRKLYQQHIAFEDEQLFPAARRALDEPTITDIGREMAERRGIHT